MKILDARGVLDDLDVGVDLFGPIGASRHDRDVHRPSRFCKQPFDVICVRHDDSALRSGTGQAHRRADRPQSEKRLQDPHVQSGAEHLPIAIDVEGLRIASVERALLGQVEPDRSDGGRRRSAQRHHRCGASASMPAE